MIKIVVLMAYINPGTGSLFLQFLLISLSGAWATLWTSRRWIKEHFIRKKLTQPTQKPDGG